MTRCQFLKRVALSMGCLLMAAMGLGQDAKPGLYTESLSTQAAFEKHWIVQLSKVDPKVERFVKIIDGKLHIRDPRGCTVWLKHKLKAPVEISYTIVAPSEFNSSNDIVPRDINNFWMSNSPLNDDPFGKGGLFDGKTYTGDFGTYHKITGYYASTGGGPIKQGWNKTTRFRRYPRKVKNKDVNHVLLNDKDDTPGYLITPDKAHHVRLITFKDRVEYHVDGKVVYSIKLGDKVPIAKGRAITKKKAEWGKAPWTHYQEGYFGLRSTHTYHIVSDFVVREL